MSNILPIGVLSPRVGLVSDENYYKTLRSLIEQSMTFCYASLFIVDLNAHDDLDAKVLQILKALKEAVWRGVDVKLLIGGSASHLAINEATYIAKCFAQSLDIECRLLAEADQRGSHVKIISVDDFVLSGSHNWSSGAFSGQTQDSLLIESQSMAVYMRELINTQWIRSGMGD